jgi:hypothetical protein
MGVRYTQCCGSALVVSMGSGYGSGSGSGSGSRVLITKNIGKNLQLKIIFIFCLKIAIYLSSLKDV